MKNLEKYLVPLVFIIMFIMTIVIHKRLDKIESQIQKIESIKKNSTE